MNTRVKNKGMNREREFSSSFFRAIMGKVHTFCAYLKENSLWVKYIHFVAVNPIS